LKEAQLKELRRCAWDFPYFCQKYLKILDKRKKLVTLKPNPIQADFADVMDAHPFTYVLKSRKVGISTFVAAKFFWKALFRPGFEVAVIAHSEKAVLENIAPIYHRFYENLPKFMRVPLKHQTVHKLHFIHDSRIIIGTANSEGARGGTPVALHCSEFSRYENPDDTMAALFNSLGHDPEVVLETTANGMNFAYSMWNDSELEYHRIFYPWTEDPECISSKTPRSIPPEIGDMVEEFELTKEQTNWFVDTYRLKCNSKLRILHQEYPIVAEQSCGSTGGRFCHLAYPGGDPEPGYIAHAKPQKWHTYVMGVDTASGSERGDYSAFCVIDVTEPTKVKTVATYYERVMPRAFGKRVLAEAHKWRAWWCQRPTVTDSPSSRSSGFGTTRISTTSSTRRTERTPGRRSTDSGPTAPRGRSCSVSSTSFSTMATSTVAIVDSSVSATTSSTPNAESQRPRAGITMTW